MRQISHYAFANAKIKAMMSFFLKRQELEAIASARDFSSALDILGKTGYKDALEGIPGDNPDIRILERSLLRHDLGVYIEVEGALVNKWEKRLVYLLRQRYELEEVKTFVRLWHNKTPAPVKDYLIAPKICYHIDFDKLLAAASVEEFILELDGTPYKRALFNAREKYKERNQPFYLEAGLESDYYRRLAECIGNFSSADGKTAGKLLGIEVDIENINWLVRLDKYYAFGIAEVMEWFIPGGRLVKKDSIRKFYASNDPDKVIEGISAGPYAGLKGSARGNPAVLEKFLYEVMLRQVKSAMTGFPFTIGTVIGYLFLKHRETRTLISLLTAKNYGWDKEEIISALNV